MKKLGSFLKYFLPAVLSIYFLFYAYEVILSEKFRLISQLPDSATLTASIFFYALIIPISAFAWSRLLIDLGERRSVWQLTCVMGSTQFAKYIPGNVAQHLGRLALSHRFGMKLGVFISSVLVESVLAIMACLTVGILLALSDQKIWLQISGGLDVKVGEPVLAIVALVFLLSIVAIYFRHQIAERLQRHQVGFLSLRKFTLLSAFFAYSCNYLLIGVGIWLIASSMEIAHTLNYSVLTATFAWAWIIGFFAPGAPAGLGVREGILVLVFNQFANDSEVLSLVITLRLVTLLGDLFWFVVSSIGLTTINSRAKNA